MSKARKRIKTRVPGIYRYGTRYSFTYRDGLGRQRWGSAGTMAEAKNKRAALRADVARGEWRELSSITFADYARTWIETYSGRGGGGVREGTKRDYRRALGLDEDGNPREDRPSAVGYFGRSKLAAIAPPDVKAYLETVKARGVAQNTIRLALAPLRAMFATAVEEGLIRSNPCTGVRLPKVTKPPKEVRALTEEELARLLDATTEERWRLLFAFIVQTGLRISEAVALTWADVTFGDRPRVKVTKAFREGVLEEPKSKYAKREVPLGPGMAQTLWRLRGTHGDDELVFVGARDGRIDASDAFRRVKVAAEDAGVPWAGLHTLRHTCATILFKRGLNAKQVQVWLGHHSPAFTLATYVHVIADDLPEPDFFDQVAPVAAPEAGNGDVTEDVTGPTETGGEAVAAIAPIPVDGSAFPLGTAREVSA